MHTKVPAAHAAWREKDTAFLTGGAFMIGMGLIIIVITGFLVFIIAFLIPFFIGPGVVMLVYGWHAHRVEAEIVDFTTRVRTYRRIKLNDLATSVGRPRSDVDRLLARAIDMGVPRGVVDRATGEFIVQDTAPHQAYVELCPGCGGRVGRWAFPEERFPCPYRVRGPRSDGRVKSAAPPLNISRPVVRNPSRGDPSWCYMP